MDGKISVVLWGGGDIGRKVIQTLIKLMHKCVKIIKQCMVLFNKF